MKTNTNTLAIAKIVYDFKGQVSKLLGHDPKRAMGGLGAKRDGSDRGPQDEERNSRQRPQGWREEEPRQHQARIP
jgi:hypothetical protein